ncbi:MAG: ATP-dependent Clp protease adaptor ClpS [Chloroflexi bacterium]|nr:ATP-dependent Clp protease adaptor ClpS [Chloroflexota bacterium]
MVESDVRLEVNREEETSVETERELELVVGPATGDRGRVLLHNDDVTTMDFVVFVLRSVFELSGERAEDVMLAAHLRGIAYVATYPLEEAKYRVGQAHALARAEGFPLTLTIEPED